jgi:hypothetical protein
VSSTADPSYVPRHARTTSPALTDDRRPLFDPAQSGRLAVQGWLVSRLLVILVALIQSAVTTRPLPDVMIQWDVVHYIAIAEHGYTTLTQAAFFPGLPALLAGFGLIGVPPLVTGTLISIGASGFAAWALYRMAGRGVAGAIAALAWSFAPMAVFTVVPYTEALFCAVGFWSIWRAMEGRWAAAAVLACLASLTRVSGLFLIGTLVLMAVFARPRSWSLFWSRLKWLGLPVLALFAYVTYLRWRFGSWTAWFDAQSQGWGRSFHWPWEAIRATADAAGITAPLTSVSVIFQWELLAWVVGVLLTIWCLAHREVPWAAWIGVQLVAFSSQAWLISLARSMITWYPLCLGLAAVAGRLAQPGPNRLRRIGFLVGFAIIIGCELWWANRFFSGAWSG